MLMWQTKLLPSAESMNLNRKGELSHAICQRNVVRCCQKNMRDDVNVTSLIERGVGIFKILLSTPCCGGVFQEVV